MLFRSIPPEAFFVASASAQYAGAVIAVKLFDDLAPASVAWFRVIGAAAICIVVSIPQLMRGGRWSSATKTWIVERTVVA